MKIFVYTLLIFNISTTAVIAAEQTLDFTLTSNYVFRGLTQTSDKAAVQVDYQLFQKENTGFYLGAFASNVAKGAEVDVFGGFKFPLFKQSDFTVDVGGIEYLYTDNDFAPISHDVYAGLEYKSAYVKYYFGEEEAVYLDIGAEFKLFTDTALLLHFGEVFKTAQNGNDFSLSLEKEFDSFTAGLTTTYEDKTANKESELFLYLSSGF